MANQQMANEATKASPPPARSHLRFAHVPFAICLSLPFIFLIRAYQVLLGPLLGGHCRFTPTCSHYALEAFRLHNPLRAAWLTIRRLARCHPAGGQGYDPVPLPSPPRR
jgi:uncharacterized protein